MCTLAASISRLVNPIAARRSKFGAAMVSGGKIQGFAEEILAEGPFVEGEFDVERGRQRGFHLRESLIREALGFQGGNIDRGRVGERAVANRIGLDLRELAFAVSERAQGLRHGAVDDLPP